jgi:hypothetical protein
MAELSEAVIVCAGENDRMVGGSSADLPLKGRFEIIG